MALAPHRPLSYLALPILIVTTWGLSACSGSAPSAPGTSPPPSTPATTAVTYSGTFQSSNGSFGSINVTAQVPAATLLTVGEGVVPQAVTNASGTLKPGGGSTQALTGTYDTATGQFMLTGGTYTVAATVMSTEDGNVLHGTITTPTTQGAVAALPPPTSGTLINYCGSYTGDTRGTIVMTRHNSKLIALVSEVGTAADSVVKGTITGNAVYLKYDYPPPDVGTTIANGTLDGSVITGLWLAQFVEAGEPVEQRGEWTVRAGACPL